LQAYRTADVLATLTFASTTASTTNVGVSSSSNNKNYYNKNNHNDMQNSSTKDFKALTGFWATLLHLIRGRPALGTYLASPSALRAALVNNELEALVRVAGKGGQDGCNSSSSSSSSVQQLDVGTIEEQWRLIFELVRLELLAGKLGEGGMDGRGEGGEKDRRHCWALIEYVIAASGSLDLLRNQSHLDSGSDSSINNNNNNNNITSNDAGRHRYLVMVVRRLRTLLKVWKPEGDLVANLWLALVQSSVARLNDAPQPNPAFSALPLVKTVVRTCCQHATSTSTATADCITPAALWTRDWSVPRDLLWQLADPRYCALPPSLVLPPPSLLRDLPRGDAVRRLVSRGCDELLLLAASLLERYMHTLTGPDARRDFLLGLLSRLEALSSSPVRPSTAASASEGEPLPKSISLAGMATRHGKTGGGATSAVSAAAARGAKKREHLLGLHNVALALLVLVDKGQAEQKVLLNFWRRLKQFASSCPSGGGEGGKGGCGRDVEAALALSVQFLALIGPSGDDKIDFLHYPSLLDTLWQWFATLAKMASVTTSNSSSSSSSGGGDGGSGKRYSRVALWSMLNGLTFAFQLSCTFTFPPEQVSKLLSVLGGLLGQYREMDDATLGLLLRAYRCLCPLRKVSLSQHPSARPLLEQVPLFASLVKGQEAKDDGVGLLWTSSSAASGGGGGEGVKGEEAREFAAFLPVPEPELLQALGTLTKESWETGSGSNSVLAPLTDAPSCSSLRLLHMHLHALPALRAVAAAYALAHAKGEKPPDLPLLRASLDATEAASYRDRQSGMLRLLAPCFYDAYLVYDLPCFPALEGREYPVLAAWIGLTLEGAAWVGAGKLGGSSSSSSSSSSCATISMVKGGEMVEISPGRYLKRRYWPFTIRLLTCLASGRGTTMLPLTTTSTGDNTVVRRTGTFPPPFSSSSLSVFPPPGDTVASRLLNLVNNFQHHIPLPSSAELSLLAMRPHRNHNSFSSSSSLSWYNIPTLEQDLFGRLLLLSNVALAVAPLPGQQQSIQAKNSRKLQVLRLLAHVGGATRLLVRSSPSPSSLSQFSSSFLPPSHLLAYSFASLLLRFAAEAIQEKLLDDLISTLFPAFFLPEPQHLKWTSNSSTRALIPLAPPPSSPETSTAGLSLAAGYVGDVLRCLAQVRYGREAIIQWLRNFLQDGLVLFLSDGAKIVALGEATTSGRERSKGCDEGGRGQARLLASIAHGLWHACPCERLHVPAAVAQARASVAHEKLLGPLEEAMNKVVLFQASSNISTRSSSASSSSSIALIRQVETTQIESKLPFFRRQFILDLDLPTVLYAPFAPTLTAPERERATTKALVLLKLLRQLFDPPHCSCPSKQGVNQGEEQDVGACPSQDLFPAMGPVVGMLFQASRGGKGRAGDIEDRLFSPAMRVALALLQCPLKVTSQCVMTMPTRTRVTLWQWATNSGSDAAVAAPNGGGGGAGAGCQDGCQTESKLQDFVLEWGCLVGLLAVARGGAIGSSAQQLQQQELDLLMEELQKQTGARFAEVELLRAKNLFTPSKHVWGRQGGNADTGVVTPDIWEVAKGGSSRGCTEEEAALAKEVQAYLLAGMTEALESVAGRGAAKERCLGLWEQVRPWLSNKLDQL